MDLIIELSYTYNQSYLPAYSALLWKHCTRVVCLCGGNVGSVDCCDGPASTTGGIAELAGLSTSSLFSDLKNKSRYYVNDYS